MSVLFCCFLSASICHAGSWSSYDEVTTPADTDTFLVMQGGTVKRETRTQILENLNSSNIAFTPAGTGTVATDVQTKLRRIKSLSDWGNDLVAALADIGATPTRLVCEDTIDPLPDGVTATIPVTMVFDPLPGCYADGIAGGSTEYLINNGTIPEVRGVTWIGENITVTGLHHIDPRWFSNLESYSPESYSTWRGDGKNSTTITHNDTGVALDVDGLDYLRLADFKLDGVSKIAGGVGVGTSDFISSSLNDIWLTRFDTAAHFTRSIYNTLYDPQVSACNTGLFLEGTAADGSCTANQIFGGRFYENTGAAIKMFANGNQVEGNGLFGPSMENNGTGLLSDGGRVIPVIGAWFEGNTSNVTIQSSTGNLPFAHSFFGSVFNGGGITVGDGAVETMIVGSLLNGVAIDATNAGDYLWLIGNYETSGNTYSGKIASLTSTSSWPWLYSYPGSPEGQKNHSEINFDGIRFDDKLATKTVSDTSVYTLHSITLLPGERSKITYDISFAPTAGISTFDGSSSAVVSSAADTIALPAHGMGTGDRCSYSNGGGTSIGGLNTVQAAMPYRHYFVIRVDADTIKLATSRANSLAGTAVDITAVGAGIAHQIAPTDGGSFSLSTSAYHNGTLAVIEDGGETYYNTAVGAGLKSTNIFTPILSDDEITAGYDTSGDAVRVRVSLGANGLGRSYKFSGRLTGQIK